MNDLIRKASITLGTDAAVARFLEVSKTRLSDYKHGRRALTPYQSAKLAELVGEPWHVAALERLTELSQTEEERRYWRSKSVTLRAIGTRAAAVAFLTIGAVFPFPGGSAQDLSLSTERTIYCALRMIRRTVVRARGLFRFSGGRSTGVRAISDHFAGDCFRASSYQVSLGPLAPNPGLA